MSAVEDVDYRNTILLRIRFYRNLAKLKQSELARKARVSQSTIGQIETGKTMPSIETLILIARALEIKPHMFLMPLPEERYRHE